MSGFTPEDIYNLLPMPPEIVDEEFFEEWIFQSRHKLRNAVDTILAFESVKRSLIPTHQC